ncbi:hypothetical protein PInf_007096 [Phytophthora infestans]|nr:hypothetical protein PInf_007096 [Phytophthora infestans]
MAGSAAKKMARRGQRAPRIDDSSDSEDGAAVLHALSTPATRQQEDAKSPAKSPTSPAKTKKSSPASSVNPWSDDNTPPAVTCPRIHGVFNSWNALKAAFAR